MVHLVHVLGLDAPVLDIIIGELRVEHVGDEALGAGDACHAEEAVEELASGAGKGSVYLLGARGLTDEGDLAGPLAGPLGRDGGGH